MRFAETDSVMHPINSEHIVFGSLSPETMSISHNKILKQSGFKVQKVASMASYCYNPRDLE